MCPKILNIMPVNSQMLTHTYCAQNYAGIIYLPLQCHQIHWACQPFCIYYCSKQTFIVSTLPGMHISISRTGAVPNCNTCMQYQLPRHYNIIVLSLNTTYHSTKMSYSMHCVPYTQYLIHRFSQFIKLEETGKTKLDKFMDKVQKSNGVASCWPNLDTQVLTESQPYYTGGCKMLLSSIIPLHTH